MPSRAERRLSAIFSTDVQGYSCLIGDDEEATIRTPMAYREVFSSLIQQHHGRVVDSPGDNLLAEFGSAVDAVRCGVAVQKELAERNSAISESRKMLIRIGLNVGDVIVEAERIYEDGVNIVAPIEGLVDGVGYARCMTKSKENSTSTTKIWASRRSRISPNLFAVAAYGWTPRW